LILAYISIYVLGQDLIGEEEIKKIIRFLGIAVLTYALVETLWILPYLKQILSSTAIKNMHHLKYIISKQRVTAFFLTPNNLGIFLLFTLYAFWEYENKIAKYFLSFLTISCLLATKSIGVWICLSGTIILVVLKTRYKKYALTGVILSFCALIIVIWFRKDLLFNPNNLYFNPFYQRLKIWEKTLFLISQKPIMGYGVGNFPIWYNQNLPHYLNQTIYAHNLLLQFWFESGLAGYIWVVVFYLYVLKNLFKKISSHLFVALCCFTFLIHNSFDASFYLPKVGIFFWIFLALLLRESNGHEIKRL
jgi:O-antigen ligase